MSREQIINDTELNIEENDYQEDSLDTANKDLGIKDNAKTRKRIDDLLEQKRLKECLDEDEWEL